MKERNKWVALIITFFGGWFGIHKFYLGENVAGVFYLLFSWTFIPGLLSVFDFLWLLFVSDREFDRRFNFQLAEPESKQIINPQEISESLHSIKRLYDEGLITAGEYEEKRQKLLKQL